MRHHNRIAHFGQRREHTHGTCKAAAARSGATASTKAEINRVGITIAHDILQAAETVKIGCRVQHII